MEIKDGIIAILLILLFRAKKCIAKEEEEKEVLNTSTSVPTNPIIIKDVLNIEEVERRTDKNLNYSK
ncbi:hypothetical protein [Wocania ichthyoenteri]|uniref:hypothetical protein n=1 Tax=Wocania ichthyoenteri TaxID=1230531 RepID=UPI00053EDCB7|nr:hypothetical protein [Wocania ichthyoenteri]